MVIIPTVSYKEGIRKLVQMALKKELIPVFGAGFTAGCQACRGAVPDSRNAIMSMADSIVKSNECPLSKEQLLTMGFFDISDLFFEYVSRNQRASYFEDYFTDVRLFPNQVQFLKDIPWPYAYTLNVDDGIERNSDFEPVLPYHKIHRPNTSKKLLYKLHGDAVYESKYEDDTQENIVFSRKQYMQAITSEENQDIYQALLSDYGQRNLLFIGCSLQDEQDLAFVYTKSSPFQHEVARFVLREKEPDFLQQTNLKKHGINEIILVDHYEAFYADFIVAYKEARKLDQEQVYEFKNPSIEYENDRNQSLSLIAGKNIFDSSKNAFHKSSLHILRTVVRSIEDELKENGFVLLKGRRFSGKTYVLCSLAEYYKKRDIYYFPSDSFADEEIVEALFTDAQNSLFLFDSNSISADVYSLMMKSKDLLKEKQNYVVISANSNDNHLLFQLDCNVIELRNQFTDEELSLCKKAQDSLALAQRRKKQSNLDYLYLLKNDQNIDIPFARVNSASLSVKDRAVLIALCALDKLYYSDLIALNIASRDSGGLCQRLTPYIEMVPTTKEEATSHSAFKMVHNGKIALIALLDSFQEQDISDAIVYIVKRLRMDYSRRRLYIEIILFDTLNQLFSKKENRYPLIKKIYSDLQPLLENDMHYWVQRAKCIYRTPNSSIGQLEEAYSYAKKAYLDGRYGTPAMAALTSSLILCAIAEKEEGTSKTEDYQESVELAHESVFSEFFRIHPRYLNSELLLGKDTRTERRIKAACNHVISSSQDPDIKQKGQEILQRFKELNKCYSLSKGDL